MRNLADNYIEEIYRAFPKGNRQEKASKAYLLTDGVMIVLNGETNSRLYDSMENAKNEWEFVQDNIWTRN